MAAVFLGGGQLSSFNKGQKATDLPLFLLDKH